MNTRDRLPASSPELNSLLMLIDRDFMFSDDKGAYRPRIEKQQTGLLSKIAFIRPFLEDDERIMRVVRACSPYSFIEHFLQGWYIVLIKRCLLVFTNKRVFHIPTRINYAYRFSIAEIRYGDCEAIRVTMLGGLEVKYKTGKREAFNYVDGRDRKKLRVLLETRPLSGETSEAKARVHLCPRCTKELKHDVYTCLNCRLAFKSRAEARRAAIIYPGGGYFYTGHFFLGFSDALVEGVLLFVVVMSLLEVIGRPGTGFPSFIIFAAILVLEKLISVFHSNQFVKEYLPKENTLKSVIGAE